MGRLLSGHCAHILTGCGKPAVKLEKYAAFFRENIR